MGGGGERERKSVAIPLGGAAVRTMSAEPAWCGGAKRKIVLQDPVIAIVES